MACYADWLLKEGVQDIEARTTALLAAPAGRAFLRIADISGLAPEVVARPAVSMHIAARAVDEVNPWRSDHDSVLAALPRRGAQFGVFARAFLTLSQASWWFGPLDRTQQLWLSRNDGGPAATQLNIPEGAPNSWERYAQKPVGGLYTSTLAEGTSAVLAVLAEGVGDLAAAFQVRPLAC
jgi:hypothetical protein